MPMALSVPTVAGITCCSMPTSFMCQRPSSWPVLFGTYADGSDKKTVGIGYGPLVPCAFPVVAAPCMHVWCGESSYWLHMASTADITTVYSVLQTTYIT
jgi:hypothetical protein